MKPGWRAPVALKCPIQRISRLIAAVMAFFYGTMPEVVAQFVAYVLYRWEINIRMAAILGVVGAGGLGQMLYMSLSLFQQPQAMTVIIAMLSW